MGGKVLSYRQRKPSRKIGEIICFPQKEQSKKNNITVTAGPKP